MSVVGGRNAAFRPFTPRIAQFDYVSVPEMPIVFIDAGQNSELANCDPLYPFDERNLSILDGAFQNVLTDLAGNVLTDLAGETLTPL